MARQMFSGPTGCPHNMQNVNTIIAVTAQSGPNFGDPRRDVMCADLPFINGRLINLAYSSSER